MQLKRGSLVVDLCGDYGIVVKIVPGTDVDDHGTVYVWQMNKFDYGADNCEHYPEFEWEKSLTVIEE